MGGEGQEEGRWEGRGGAGRREGVVNWIWEGRGCERGGLPPLALYLPASLTAPGRAVGRVKVS